MTYTEFTELKVGDIIYHVNIKTHKFKVVEAIFATDQSLNYIVESEGARLIFLLESIQYYNVIKA